MNHTKNPAADKARGALDNNRLGGKVDRENSPAIRHLQVRTLLARFPVSEPHAAAVAPLAFGEVRHD
jgi:hypothetical protein